MLAMNTKKENEGRKMKGTKENVNKKNCKGKERRIRKKLYPEYEKEEKQ